MNTRICTFCHKEKELKYFHKCKGLGFKDGVYPKCKECRKLFSRLDYIKRKNKIKKNVREYRKTENGKRNRHNEYESFKRRHPEKVKTYSLFSNAIRCGRLKRKHCEICGSLKSQGHHTDYSKPLEVIWLCQKHHQELHNKVKDRFICQ